MTAPVKGGKPAHGDGDRQRCADNVVESFEKAANRNDASKDDRNTDDAFRCSIVEFRQAPIGPSRSKQAARYSRRRGNADHRLAGSLHERLQSRIGEIEGLEYERDDIDHREWLGPR